jgi:hypothetical protein
MIDDARLEADLRTMLGRRDPGPAPSSLVDFVRDVIAVNDSRPRWMQRIEPAVHAVSALGIVGLAAFAFLFLFGTVQMRGPGATSPPPAPVPYVLAAGDGVVAGDGAPVLQVGLGIALVVTFGLVALTTASRRRRIAATLAALVVVLVGLSIGTSDAVGFVNGGYGVDPGRTSPSPTEAMSVAVNGDGPFTMLLTVTNTSRLPLEIRGVPALPVEASAGSMPSRPRFAGLGLLGADFDPNGLQRFHPVSLEPGQEANLLFLGLAGSCAIAEPEANGTAYELPVVELVYEQLTIVHTARIELPSPVVISTKGGC